MLYAWRAARHYMPYPFQIIQSTNKIVVAYAFNNASRTISLASHPEAPVDSWMGWSNGRWEGIYWSSTSPD